MNEGLSHALVKDDEERYPMFLQNVLVRLENELDPALYYHNILHTRDVIKEATRLAREDKCSVRDQHLVLIAAAFHDVGFLTTRKGHEEEGALYVIQCLEAEGCFSAEEILLVAQMIRDTCLVPRGQTMIQVCRSPLSAYILDADLANFGRSDFREKTELVRRELSLPVTKAFYEGVTRLVAAHQWQSRPAREQWAKEQENNLAALHAELAIWK